MSKRPYSRAFNLNIAQSVESDELRPAQTCRAYQIGENVLSRWYQEVRPQPYRHPRA